ncbi:hypothetical protein BJX68DRAFT_232987 [Aspergillus pseudodeflectus]|uniref:Uncharacterized protein n=1 Tax=Aspergillus pseudodeflectus TaxID=176178 RepID=A0ABR4KPJ7_9EURO
MKLSPGLYHTMRFSPWLPWLLTKEMVLSVGTCSLSFLFISSFRRPFYHPRGMGRFEHKQPMYSLFSSNVKSK